MPYVRLSVAVTIGCIGCSVGITTAEGPERKGARWAAADCDGSTLREVTTRPLFSWTFHSLIVLSFVESRKSGPVRARHHRILLIRSSISSDLR